MDRKEEHADAIFHPCGRKFVLTALFSVIRDGKVSKPEAIFHPPQTEIKTMWTLLSVCVDKKISKLEAILRPPLTKK